MLTHEKLARLYRDRRGDKVLSIYLDGQANDPAQRKVWRRRLEQRIAEAEQQLVQAPAEERVGFGNALSLLKEELAWFDSFLPGRGWVGFATPDTVLYSETVAVPMPDLVRWEDGIRVAPYVRGLKQGRPVLVVLVDRRKARIFEYVDGSVSELPGVLADTDVGDLTDARMAKRGGTHTGVRGQTGTEAAQRFLEAGAERMFKRLADELSSRLEQGGFLVIGGPSESVSALTQLMPGWLDGRLYEQPSLAMDMTLAQVRDAAEAAATALTCRVQEGLVDEVVDLARAGGRGCLGVEETERALREARVDTLLLTRSFIREHPDFADRCVGAAFDQHAEVEELSGAAGLRLDAECGGIGARLRFVIRNGASAPDGRSDLLDGIGA